MSGQAITEFGDCTPEERDIEELNSGIYQIDAHFSSTAYITLGQITPKVNSI